MDKYLLIRLTLNFFELAAFIVGLIFWKKFSPTPWKWFIVYLGIIAVSEIFLEYCGYVLKRPQVTADVNFYFTIPFEFIFFFVMFLVWFGRGAPGRWMVTGIVLYVISFIIDIIFLGQTRAWFYSFSYTAGNIILLVSAIIFFFKFMNSDDILVYRSSVMFWVCTGLLIYFLGSLPFFGLWNTLVANYPHFFNDYWLVVMCLNCMMYLFFCFGFIWGKPK